LPFRWCRSICAQHHLRAATSRIAREDPTPNHQPVMAKGNNSHRKEVKKPKKEKPKPQPTRRGE